MPYIEEILERRSDLSTFLVHFTRAAGETPAIENLKSILSTLTVEARSPLGMASAHQARLLTAGLDQRVACFSETPIEFAWAMTAQIPGRQVQLAPYGIAVTKKTGRERGANPIWYLDQTSMFEWLTAPVNELVAAAVAELGDADSASRPRSSELFKLTPFLEQFGPYKDFYWEREWRCRRDFNFRPRQLVCAFAPVEDHNELSTWWASGPFSNRPLPLLDPAWGLERMVKALSGVDDD